MVFANIILVAAALMAPPDSLKIQDCRFEDAYSFQSASCSIKLTNEGKKEITVSVVPDYADDAVGPKIVKIPAGRSAEVQADVALRNAVGEVVHYFRVVPVGATHAIGSAKVGGFVLSALNDVRPALDMGSIDVTVSGQNKTIRIESNESENFRLSKVLETPPGVRATVQGDGRTVQVALTPDAAWAMLDGDIKISTQDSQQTQVWVRISANAHGPISAPGNPISMGVLAWDSPRELAIPLKEKSGRSFEIGPIRMEGNLTGDAKEAACEPAMADCKAIRLKLSDKQTIGLFRGAVVVDLPDYKKPLSISVFGLLRPPVAHDEQDSTQAIKTGSQNPDSSRDGLITAGNKVTSLPIKLAQDGTLTKEPSQTDLEQVVPAGRGPLLKWTITQDDGVHGYQIFRASAAEGPFNLMTAKVIPAQVRKGGSSFYAWRDTTAEPGSIHWYYVGIVYVDGHKQQLTGAQRAVAK